MALLDLTIHEWFKPRTATRHSDLQPSRDFRSMKRHGIGSISLRIGVIFASIAVTTSAVAAPDPGKKACVKEARVLCPAEMKSLSRKKVEACMIRNVEKTSPTCKSAMLRIKAEREASAQRQTRGQAATSE